MADSNSGCGGSLVLLSGLPGAGKTTFARALTERLPARHIESDEIRRRIAGRPAYTRDENARVFGRVERLAREALGRGECVVLDATNLTVGDRKRFARLVEQASAGLVCVRVTAPDEVIRERLARPREGFSEATTAVYERMRGRVQGFRQPAVVVDTRFGLEPSVRLIEALAGCGRA